MRCIKHKFLLYFSSESRGLFIDGAHLATCHNIRKSETKIMFKAFSLTYKCRERVGPGPPPPVLSMNLLLRGAQPIPVLFTFPPDSLSSDDTQTHTGILRAGRLVQGSHRGNHAYISCCLFQRSAMMHSQTMNRFQSQTGNWGEGNCFPKFSSSSPFLIRKTCLNVTSCLETALMNTNAFSCNYSSLWPI